MKPSLIAIFILFPILSAFSQQSTPVLQRSACFIEVTPEAKPSVRISQVSSNFPPRVRVAYVVPSNRTPQADYKENLQFAIEMSQKWYRDNMAQNGFGPKTFTFETEENSLRPKIHLVNVPENDVYLRGNGANDLFFRTQTAAQNAGLSVGTDGEVWILIPETLLQASDGSFTGGLALGSGATGTGIYGGVAQLSSSVIHLFNPQTILNNSPYAGHIVPAWGTFPLQQDISFAWFEGSTFSSTASSYLGALCHELGHAFGLFHELRDNNNFFGGLMSNGLRGIRGSIFPSLYPADYTRLEYSSSLQLNHNQYFNANKVVKNAPTITVVTSGTVSPINGLLNINFLALGSDTLAYAHLINASGDVIEELVLNQINVGPTFKTPFFTAGKTTSFRIAVGDIQGNRKVSSNFTLTIAAGGNYAPLPTLKIYNPNSPSIENYTLFQASSTTDPNNDSFTTEFDFNNDGTYDTPPLSLHQANYIIPQAGPYMARIRVTDSQGASAVSTPISGNFGKQCAIEPPIITGSDKMCVGSSVELTANSCYGSLTWSNGSTAKSIIVSPSVSTSYTVNCIYACSNQTSQPFLVNVIPENLQLSGSAITGILRGNQTITSTQTIENGISTTYITGNSIVLLPNFTAEAGSNFSTKFQFCDYPLSSNDNIVALIDGITTLNILSNDVNPDGSPITDLSHISPPTIVTNPTQGTVTVNPDGTIGYTSTENAAGTDNFVYSICNNNQTDLCSNASVTITFQPLVNPVQNPGFESNVSFTNAPWIKGGWKTNQAVFSWLPTQGRNNSSCIKIFSGSASNDVHVYQTVTLAANTNYTLKGWVKTENVTGISNPNSKGAFLCLLIDGNAWPPTSAALLGSTDWTRLSLNFNSGASGIVKIACRLGYTNQDSEGTAYFDDLKIVPW